MRFLPVLLLVLILVALLGVAMAGVTSKPTAKKTTAKKTISKKTTAKKTTPKKTAPKKTSPKKTAQKTAPKVSTKVAPSKSTIPKTPAPVISIPPGVGSRPVKPGYPAGIFVEMNSVRKPVAYLDTATVNYNITIDVIPGNRRTWFESYLPNNAYLIIGSPGYPADSGVTRSFYDVELRNWPFKDPRNTLMYIMNWPWVFIGNTAGGVRMVYPDNCAKGPCQHVAVSVMNTKMLNVSVPPTINIDGVQINRTMTINASHIQIPSIPNYKFELAFYIEFELIDLTKIPKSPFPIPPSKSMALSVSPLVRKSGNEPGKSAFLTAVPVNTLVSGGKDMGAGASKPTKSIKVKRSKAARAGKGGKARSGRGGRAGRAGRAARGGRGGRN